MIPTIPYKEAEQELIALGIKAKGRWIKHQTGRGLIYHLYQFIFESEEDMNLFKLTSKNSRKFPCIVNQPLTL